MRVVPKEKYVFNNFTNNNNSNSNNNSNNVEGNSNNVPFNMASWFACHKNQQQLSQLELQPSCTSDSYNPRSADSIKQLYQSATGNSEFSNVLDSSKRHDLIYDIHTPSRTLTSQHQQQLIFQHHSSHNYDQLNASSSLPTDFNRPVAKPVLLYVSAEKQQPQSTGNADATQEQTISIVSKFSDMQQCECRSSNNKDVVCDCFEHQRCQKFLKIN